MRFAPLCIALTVALLVAACRTAEPPKDYTAFGAPQDPETVAARVAHDVGTCWFKTRRPAFVHLTYAAELNSYTGRPRVLIVPRQDPHGLPQLVIEVTRADRGSSVRLFGPLLGTAEAATISRDVERWVAGGSGCTA